VSEDELLSELIAEISLYSPEELTACLADRQLSTEGDRDTLVTRLAQAVAQE